MSLYFAFQFLFCSLIMLVPTTLMGATFPVVSRRITHGMEEMGRKVGDAYSVNTFGAILGSLIGMPVSPGADPGQSLSLLLGEASGFGPEKEEMRKKALTR